MSTSLSQPTIVNKQSKRYSNYGFELLILDNIVYLTFPKYISDNSVSACIIRTIAKIIPNKPIELVKYSKFKKIIDKVKPINAAIKPLHIIGICTVDKRKNIKRIFLDGEEVNVANVKHCTGTN